MKSKKKLNLFIKNSNYSGSMKLEFEMEESIYLIELMLKQKKEVCTFDLNSLNDIFYKKFLKAYTVDQYQQMSKVNLILKGKSTLSLLIFADCIYGTGQITFVKGKYFYLAQSLILTQKNLRPVESLKRKPLQITDNRSEIEKTDYNDANELQAELPTLKQARKDSLIRSLI